jgi:hypothetical protein
MEVGVHQPGYQGQSTSVHNFVPLGTTVVLLGPTEWIRPFRTNTVISLFGAPPVPSISLTPVIATLAEGCFCGSDQEFVDRRLLRSLLRRVRMK